MGYHLYSNHLKQTREGKGKYVYANQDEYEGDYKANLKHGIGKMVYKPKGEPKGEYYGYWENGCKSGEGVFTYVGGDIYSGNWKNNKRDGKGTYIFSGTGIKYMGNWSEGNFVQGKWLFPNGTFFEGAFEANQPKGTGHWLFKNKDVVEGEYTQMVEQENMDAAKNIKLAWKTTSDIVKGDA